MYFSKDCRQDRKLVKELTASVFDSFNNSDNRKVRTKQPSFAPNNAVSASIVIPDSVTKIGKHAFSGCKALADKEGFVIVNETLYSYYGDNKEVSIPDDVISIESEAFWQAGEMTKLYISENVVSIDPYMVGYGSRLKTIITSKGSAAELFAKEYRNKNEQKKHYKLLKNNTQNEKHI